MRLDQGLIVQQRYRIIRPIGQGGMATTYLFEDLLWGTRGVLKVLEKSSPAVVESFRYEFALLSGLLHPNLAKVHDFGAEHFDDEVLHFYTSELVDGVTLDAYVKGRSWEEVCGPIADTLSALVYLHGLGIRHGDVKEANIVVDKAGRGVLVDFGCAGPFDAPRGHAVSGTPEYAAPELLGGGLVDGRADLYSLGVALGHVLEGLKAPAWLHRLSQRLLERRPSRRPSEALEVLESLDRSVSDAVQPTGHAQRLVGRQHEMDLARELLDDLVDGRPSSRALLLHGPPGIGKSRLLQEMKWMAQLRCPVYEALGSESPVESMLHRAMRSSRERGLEAALGARDRLSEGSPPTVFIADDVQSIGDGELLISFLRILEPQDSIFVIATCLEAPKLTTRAVRALEVKPLEKSDIDAWTRGLLDAQYLPDLVELTGGVPAYIESFARKLAVGELHDDDLSTLGGASAPILGRRELDSLQPADLEVLALFAVLGGEIDQGATFRFGFDDRAFISLHRNGWISRSSGGFRLIRVADVGSIIESLDADLVAKMHARAAEDAAAELTASHQGPASKSAAVARLVYHLLGGGHLEDALRRWADDRELFLLHPRPWRQVAEALERHLGSSDQAQLMAAEIHHTTGHPERALPLLSEVITSPSSRKTRAAAEQQSGACYVRLGEPVRALKHLEGALELHEDAASRAATLDLLSRLLIQQGAYEDALKRSEEGLLICDSRGRAALLHENVGVSASYLGQAEVARDHLGEAERLHEGADRPRDQIRVQSYRAIFEFRSGELEAAIAGYRRSLGVAEKHGLSDLVANAALNLGTALQSRGDLGPALTSYERGLRIARALGKVGTEATIAFNVANLYFEVGLYDRALSGLDTARSAAESCGLAHLEAGTEIVRGEVALARGDHLRAGRWFESARHRFKEEGAAREIVELDLHLAEVSLATGDWKRAAALLDDVDALLMSIEASDVSAKAGLVRGRLFAQGGRDSEAIDTLETALHHGKESGQRILEATISLSLAEVCKACEALVLAKAHRARAQGLLERTAASLPGHLRDCFWEQPRWSALGSREASESRSYRPEFRRLLEVNKRLNSSLSVNAVLVHAMDAAIELTSSERGFIVLKRSDKALEVPVARNLDRERIGRSHLKFSRSIAEQVLSRDEPVLTVDAEADDRFRGNESVQAMRLKSVACVPIRSPEGVLGALYLDNRFAKGLFGDHDLELLLAFADQVALALSNARLHETLKHRTVELEAEQERVQALLSHQAHEIDRLHVEVQTKQKALEHRFDYSQIIGRSRPMVELLSTLDRIIDTSFSVLVNGESGTGKELVSRAIHFNSPRRERPFVSVNCAAIPATLLESELFGHRRGAFTGAERDRVGLIQTAQGGTLFLDEIGEMPLAMQAKLLRVVEERKVRALGSSEALPVDFRLLAATNRDLDSEINAGMFRNDLYFRIAQVEITVPPLRERADDIPELSGAILERLAAASGKKTAPQLTREALHALLDHPWPGNVRQLENVLSRAFVVARHHRLTPSDLGLARPSTGREHAENREDFERQEAKRILTALNEAGWNVAATIRRLGMPKTTLYRKMKRYGLIRPRRAPE